MYYNHGFYPIKIEVQSLEHIGQQYHSKIVLFGSPFYGKTFIENDVIHTIVVQNTTDFKRILTIKDTTISKDENGLPFCTISNQPVSKFYVSHPLASLFLHISL